MKPAEMPDIAPALLPRFQYRPKKKAGANIVTASKDFRPMSTRL